MFYENKDINDLYSAKFMECYFTLEQRMYVYVYANILRIVIDN